MTTRRARFSGRLVPALVWFALAPVALAQAPADPPSSGPQLSSAKSTPLQTSKTQTRGVVELFTSQGCSSCPAADRLLGELKKDPTLIAVSLPVTYWDYLGWKDTLADPRHTARQTAYSHARGDRAVYTPQAVVNGTVHVLGSDRAAIEGAMTRSRSKGTALSVPVRLSIADGRLSVSTDPAKGVVVSGVPVGAPTGEVWLLGLSSTVEVSVGRGENTGRTLVYSNVVRHWVKLGDWTGSARTWSVPVGDIAVDKVDAVAVLVQGGSAARPGTILGAAFERLD